MSFIITLPFITVKEGAYMSEEKKSRYTEAQAKAAKKYLKESVEDIRIRVPKGQKDVIRAAAEEAKQSLNSYVRNSVNKNMYTEEMELNLNKPANWNLDLQEELEKYLREPKHIISQLSKIADSRGKYSIGLRFKEESVEDQRKIAREEIEEILNKYDIKIKEEA